MISSTSTSGSSSELSFITYFVLSKMVLQLNSTEVAPSITSIVLQANGYGSASALIRVTVEIVPTFIVSYLRVNS